MNRRFVWQKAMQIKQDLPTYNVLIYLRTEFSKRKKRRGPNKKKICEIKSGSYLRSEFDPHRHMRRKASVRQYNGAGMILLYFNLWAEHVLFIYDAGIY
jgi:hypothetical protein